MKNQEKIILPEKCGKRTVILVCDQPPTNKDEVAKALARLVTDGDYAGYVRRAMENRKAGMS